MRHPAFMLPALFALAAAATAQDGGKLAWRGKTGDPRAAMADAARELKPIMLFFTSDG